MSDNSGLRDRLLEKNEISDNYFEVDQQSDSMTVEEQNNEIRDNTENSGSGSLKTKDSKGNPVVMGTSWVYRDENGKQFYEKQLCEDDITGDHLEIPRRLAHYIQSLKLHRRIDAGEKTRKVNLVCDNGENENECYYFTGQWRDFVKENKLKVNKDLVRLEISQQLGLRIGYTNDQKAIDMNNPVLLRRLSRADVKSLYIKKLCERYSYSSGGTGLIEIEPIVQIKLCSQVVYRYGGIKGVMFIQLPKKDVEENLGCDLPLPGAGGEIAMHLFDPVGNNLVEMKLLHTEKGEYHIGGAWEVYAAKYGLLISDTIFLDKVNVHAGNDHDQLNTAQFSCHYEITYQRRRRGGTKDQSRPAALANSVKDVPRVPKIESGYEGDSSWLQYCTP
ncbi:uncharacterized protein LOC132048402 isoform X2 [Lycium ferocissimum]|uniref:uncharacterized protein LOC132048402 isoform X2 n=1 Tax=Lycium ferocissimum TaxID=112874 RepID=UPI0028151E55|nr:uncharacterized protein LOC132048402 isoform X2 [Lycium ferocissimum]